MQHDPLANVMDVDPEEEDQDEHEEHSPELTTPPLRQPKLRQQLSSHVVHFLHSLTWHTAFVGYYPPDSKDM